MLLVTAAFFSVFVATFIPTAYANTDWMIKTFGSLIKAFSKDKKPLTPLGYFLHNTQVDLAILAVLLVFPRLSPVAKFVTWVWLILNALGLGFALGLMAHRYRHQMAYFYKGCLVGMLPHGMLEIPGSLILIHVLLRFAEAELPIKQLVVGMVMILIAAIIESWVTLRLLNHYFPPDERKKHRDPRIEALIQSSPDLPSLCK